MYTKGSITPNFHDHEEMARQAKMLFTEVTDN